MKYYAFYNESGEVVSFGLSCAATVPNEISAAEYLELKQRALLVRGYTLKLSRGEIALEDVPEEYRVAVRARVAELAQKEA